MHFSRVGIKGSQY